MSQVINLTAATFEKAASKGTPLLAYILVPNCGPCHLQGYILKEVAEVVGAKAIVGRVNADAVPGLAERFDVQSAPTLVVLKGRQILKRMIGLQTAQTLIEALQQAGG